MIEKSRRRVAIYKGAFDPVHNGHEAIMQAALEDPLNEIVYVFPSGIGRLPNPKSFKTQNEHRLEMVRRTCQALKNPGKAPVQVMDHEMAGARRPNHVSMLADLLKAHSGKDIVIYAGSDMVHPYWTELAGQRDLDGGGRKFKLHFMINLRCAPDEEAAERERLQGAFDRFKESLHAEVRHQIGTLEFFRTELDHPHSSAEVRELIAQGKPFEHLVPEAVADYIKEKGLYGFGQGK